MLARIWSKGRATGRPWESPALAGFAALMMHDADVREPALSRGCKHRRIKPAKRVFAVPPGALAICDIDVGASYLPFDGRLKIAQIAAPFS
jgi:hypothetical protein